MVKIDMAGTEGEALVYGDAEKVMKQLAGGIALAIDMIQADQKEEITKEVVLNKLFNLVKDELSSQFGERKV